MELKKRKLTMKQELFVEKMLENGLDATKAGRAVWVNAKNADSAGAIGRDALRKPLVRETLKERMEARGITQDFVASNLKKVVTSGIGIKAKNSDSLRGLETIAKLMGEYPAAKSIHARFNFNQQAEMEGKSLEEIKEMLQELNKRTTLMIQDAQ